MKIITITLNPAFDVHYEVENFSLNKENYALNCIRQAGGKGINISGALGNFNIKNTSFCVVGKASENDFFKLLKNDNVSYVPIVVEGSIRENITIHSNGKETRLSSEGFKTDLKILNEISATLAAENLDHAIVTFTGRLPKGISTEVAVEFLIRVKEMGAKIIVDCNSFTFEDLIKIKPFLIKPNEQEISQLFNEKINSKSEAISAGKQLYKAGIKNVIVSLGADGFIYIGADGVFTVDSPKITPLSTIGAGDSLIAGFIAGFSMDKKLEDTLKLAASFGSAACLTKGTIPPEKDVILNLINKVKITEYAEG